MDKDNSGMLNVERLCYIYLSWGEMGLIIVRNSIPLLTIDLLLAERLHTGYPHVWHRLPQGSFPLPSPLLSLYCQGKPFFPHFLQQGMFQWKNLRSLVVFLMSILTPISQLTPLKIWQKVETWTKMAALTSMNSWKHLDLWIIPTLTICLSKSTLQSIQYTLFHKIHAYFIMHAHLIN